MSAIYKKIGLIILLFTFTFSLYFFNGSIDEFAPSSITPANEVIKESHIPNNYEIELPGFYAYVASISEISGIPVRNFLFLPIQLVPHMLIFFLLIYRFSNSYVISSLVTFIEMLSPSAGTFGVFLWPHGEGAILLYLSLLILLHLINEGQINLKRKPEFCCLVIISGFSMVFLSYDYFAYLFFLLISILTIFLVQFIFQDRNKKQKYKLSVTSKRIINLMIIFIIIEFGVSKFFYVSFLSSVTNPSTYEVSLIDKFIASYFYHEESSSDIMQLMIHYPKILSEINLIKYMCLAIMICIFILSILKKMNQKYVINNFDIVPVYILGMNFLYGLCRMFLGQIPIALIFYPSLFCTLWLYRFSDKYKNLAIFVLILLLVLIPVSFCIKNDGYINKDPTKYSYTNYPADWYLIHKGDFIGNFDELTRDFLLLRMSEQSTYNMSYSQIHQNTKILSIDDILFLIQKNNKVNTSQYYVINYRLSMVVLNSWRDLKSWKYSKNLIENNTYINKIYDFNDISIYSSYNI